MSEDETDDEPSLDADSDEKHEERTSAAVVADEGRGLIVQGDNAPIVQLQVQPGPSCPKSPVLLLIHLYRYHSPSHRIIFYPQCSSRIPLFCPPPDCS